MKKPHVVPLPQYFLKSQYRATHCVDEHFYVRFDAHSVSFKPVVWSENAPGTINNILHKFAAVLRVSNEKHFSRLSLHFYECQGLDTVILSRLGSELAKHFRNLRELTLFLFSCDQIKEKGIQKFLSLISKSLKNLKKLNISVLGYTKLDDKGESYIRRFCMNRLKNLEKLNLVFSREQTDILEEHLPYETNLKKHILKRSLLDWMMKYSNPDPISSEATISLYYTVRQFSRNLQQLTLAFPDLTLESQSLNRLSSVLRCFRGLKKLFLGLNYGEALENDELGEELSCSLRCLSSLQSLTLRFGTVNFITTGFLAKISGVLSHLPHLREFGLSFVSELMKDKDFCSLVTQICLGAKNLEFLTLCFDQIGDVSNKAITQAIQDICYHLSCLKGLIFDCLYTTSSNKDVSQIVPKQIFQPLSQLHLYLPNSKFELDLFNCCEGLRELTLSFNDCRQMTDFSKLFTHISSLNFKSINRLNLLFNQARFLNDESFKILSSLDWTSLSNLKHLSLGFLWAQNISDTALDYIRLCILEHFIGLLGLEISFKCCDSITENGIKLLCMTIVRHMTQLKGLVIDFSSVSVSKVTTETIVNKIAVSFKELEKLRLKFTNDNHYDAVFMSEMRKKLWSIHEVDFYYCPPRISYS